MKTIILAVLVLLVTNNTVAQDANNKTLDTEKYSVEYPANWQLNNSGQSGTEFIVLSPRDGAADSFQENVNLIIQDLSADPMSLDDFTELSMTQMMAAGATVTENEQSATEPTRQKLVFTMVQSGYKLRLIQYYWMIEGKAHILTLTCLQDEKDEYWEAGKKVMDSFKIK